MQRRALEHVLCGVVSGLISFGLVILLLSPMATADNLTPTPAQPDLALQAKAIFTNSCYGCHGQPGHTPKAGLNILNAQYLFSTALVVPGASNFSPLFTKLTDGEMPPDGDTFPNGQTPPQPSAQDIATIKAWIDGGAPDWDGAAGPSKPIEGYETIVTAIAKDVASLDPSKAGETRYLSLVHLENQNLSDNEITSARLAMFKLINSLSTNPQIVLPVAIDQAQLIYRIDLESYKLLPRSWDRYEAVYPFGIDDPSSTAQAQILKLTGSRFPFLRADWFVEFAVRPPLYHDVLLSDQLGIFSPTGALHSLERALAVDRIGDILNGKVQRAGFDSSGVSANNRIIERHDIGIYTGAYWLSYDFLGNSADSTLRQNIFSYPLGPADAFPQSQNTFKHAGGEVIFNLPNGLQGYMLVNVADQRLDKAITQIVTDPARPDHAVENGVSCFRCHNEGMILKQDLLRPFILANQSVFGSDLNVLLDLYKDKAPFLDAQRGDLTRFLTALNSVGVSLRQPEPVSTLVQFFESDLDSNRVANEFYLTQDQLSARITTSDQLRLLIGPLEVPGGTVKRGFLIDNYQAILALLNPLQP
jgi:hypothetical protein